MNYGKDFSNLDRSTYKILEFLVSIMCFVTLYPLLEMGLVGDDAYNSQNRGQALILGFSLWQDIVAQVKGWWIGAGRLNVLGWIYTKFIFWYIDSVLVIKSAVIAIVIISIISFGRVVRHLTDDGSFAFFCIFFMPMMLQFRNWHDPFTNFIFLIPLVVCLMHFSMLALFTAVVRHSNVWFIASLLLFVAGLFTYELAYVYLFVFACIFVIHPSLRQHWRWLSFFTGLTVAHILVSKLGPYLLLPEGEVITYSGANLNKVNVETFGAYVFQLIGAFPLSWKFSPASHGVGKFNHVFIAFISLYAVTLFIYAKQKLHVRKKTSTRVVTALAVVLVFFIPVLPAISGHGKDIAKLGLGYAYITVFAQSFGVAILFALFINFIFTIFKTQKVQKVFLFSLLASASVVSTITFNENIRNVRGTHTTYKFPASALVNLHDIGFFDDWDPKHSFLIMNYRSPFSNNMYLSKILGVPIKTCYVNDPKVFEACIENYSRASLVPFVFNFNLDTNGEPIFALLCEVRSEDIGNGILANFYPKGKDCQFSDPMGRSTFKSLQNDLSHLNLQKLLISPFMLDYPEIALSYVDVFRDQIVVKGTHFPASSDNGIIAWVTDEVHLNAFLKNTEIFRRRICFDLIRPSNTPIKVKVELMYVASEEIEFLGVKNLCFDLKKSNNLLKVNALSPLEPVNTDPRNIRFGIANWMVQSTDVVVE